MWKLLEWSQSLWNRAVSSDESSADVISTLASQSLWNRAVSSDASQLMDISDLYGLNPFGTGQCLPTYKPNQVRTANSVSIPLEQGSVFRR